MLNAPLVPARATKREIAEKIASTQDDGFDALINMSGGEI